MASWRFLGASWDVLGVLGPLGGASWGNLGAFEASWGVVGASWGVLAAPGAAGDLPNGREHRHLVGFCRGLGPGGDLTEGV